MNVAANPLTSDQFIRLEAQKCGKNHTSPLSQSSDSRCGKNHRLGEELDTPRTPNGWPNSITFFASNALEDDDELRKEAYDLCRNIDVETAQSLRNLFERRCLPALDYESFCVQTTLLLYVASRIDWEYLTARFSMLAELAMVEEIAL